jgi:hypothetical protein
VIAIATFTTTKRAHATENEWHFGIAYGYSMLVHGEDTLHGTGGLFHVRYGVTDAFDLTMDAGVAGYPADGLVAPGTTAGIGYVIDVLRWIPHIGLQAGVVDTVTLTCPEAAQACGHQVRPVLAIPGGLELRVVGPLVLGAHVRYDFILPDQPSGRLFAGAYAALVTGGPIPGR